MTKKIAKYDLKHIAIASKHDYYQICGLKKVFGGMATYPFCGVAGLIKVNDYPGYCILCATYANQAVSYGHEFNIGFYPLYTENDELVLVKTDRVSYNCTVNLIPYGFPGSNDDVRDNDLMISYLEPGFDLDCIVSE